MIIEVTIGGAFAVGLVWFMVRAASRMLQRAMVFQEELVKDFKNTLDNHLEHNTEALIELRHAINAWLAVSKND